MPELLDRLRWLRPADADPPDARLLERFVGRHDESAFAALVRRHGPMVLTVCRRVLGDDHAADDAFQATFLVLARRAASLARPGPLGPWLYGVARRTASALRRRDRRRREEPLSTDLPASEPGREPEIGVRLDAALLALPAKYRTPVILCHLQGLSRRQAAAQLGCPEGTLSTHLARALAKLRRTLAAPSAGAVLAALSADRAAVPAALAAAAARVAVASLTHPLTIAAGPTVARLTQGVLRMESIRRAAPAALALLVMLGVGVGALVRPTATAADGPPAATPTAPKTITVVLCGVPPADSGQKHYKQLIAEITRQAQKGMGPTTLALDYEAPDATRAKVEWPIVVRDDTDEVGLKDAGALRRHLARLRREPGGPAEMTLETNGSVPAWQVASVIDACRGAGFATVSFRGTALAKPSALRRVTLDLVILEGDPLGSPEQGTAKLLGRPQLMTLDGQAARVAFGEGPPAATAPLLDYSFAVFPVVRADGRILLDISCDIRADAPIRSRHTLTATPGETVKVRLGEKMPGKTVWVELTARVAEER